MLHQPNNSPTDSEGNGPHINVGTVTLSSSGFNVLLSLIGRYNAALPLVACHRLETVGSVPSHC